MPAERVRPLLRSMEQSRYGLLGSSPDVAAQPLNAGDWRNPSVAPKSASSVTCRSRVNSRSPNARSWWNRRTLRMSTSTALKGRSGHSRRPEAGLQTTLERVDLHFEVEPLDELLLSDRGESRAK